MQREALLKCHVYLLTSSFQYVPDNICIHLNDILGYCLTFFLRPWGPVDIRPDSIFSTGGGYSITFSAVIALEIYQTYKCK